MTAYDAVRLAAEVAALPIPAENTTTQGKKLQDLVEWLINGVPSCQVTLKNKLDAAKTEEKDLWFTHIPSESRLPFSDTLVPVECKNEGSKASTDEVAAFGRKIAKSGGRDGILVAREGLSGLVHMSAHAEIRDQLSAGIRIVVIQGTDLPRIVTSDDLVKLMIDRHTELRTEQTYKSI